MPDTRTEHTPGPWITSYTPSDTSWSIFADEGRRFITYVPAPLGPHESRQEQFANARLIAAAPEMLELVQRIALGANQPFDHPDARALHHAGTTAHALLAKIAGKE